MGRFAEDCGLSGPGGLCGWVLGGGSHIGREEVKWINSFPEPSVREDNEAVLTQSEVEEKLEGLW
jgi:hypothetical protein